MGPFHYQRSASSLAGLGFLPMSRCSVRPLTRLLAQIPCIREANVSSYKGMQRSVMFALLTVSLLLAAPAPAQRAGGGSHSRGAHATGGSGTHTGGHPGSPNGAAAHQPAHRRHHNYYGPGVDFWGYPYWDDGALESYEDYPGPAVNVTPAPVVVVESRDDRRRAPRVLPPKMIEIPLTKEAAVPPKPQPATLFVFANGERLESRLYTITANSLYVEIGRERRTVPLNKLDLDATIAANRERGIDLQVPTDRNHIFLSF